MGDIFSDKRLKALSQIMRAMFPARSRGEHAIRRKDKASVVNEDTVVIEKSSPSVIDGALNRNKLLTGTAVFYCVDYVDARDVRRIAEAGFDFLITECGGDFRDMVLRAGYDYGLGILSKDPSLPHADGIRDALTKTALFSDYADSPAHIGDSGYDEPNTSAFGYMGEYCKRYRQALPGKVLFYNLFPAGPSSKLLGAASYGEYIDRYVREVPTDYISVDVYPFFLLQTSARNRSLLSVEILPHRSRSLSKQRQGFLDIHSNARQLVQSAVRDDHLRTNSLAGVCGVGIRREVYYASCLHSLMGR